MKGKTGSRLKRLADPSHGLVWIAQKVLWLALFAFTVVVMGLSNFAPSVLARYLSLWMYPAGFLVLFVLFNFLATVYHKLEGHSKRTPHSLIASAALLLTVAAGAGLLMLPLPGASYYAPGFSLMIGIIAASFVYEDIDKFALALPVLILLIILISYV